MPRSKSVSGFVAVTLLAATAIAQTSTPTATDAPSSVVSSTASVITSSPDSGAATATSSDIPLSLWAIADSLLTSYYPSTTLTQVASLTWPTAVVIGGATYSAHSGTQGGVISSPATSILAEATSTGTSSPHHATSSDKKLGIIIGVVVGAIAVAVLGVVFCCLWRRKRRSGAYFQRRGTPSISDSEVDAWRSPEQTHRSTAAFNPSHGSTEKFNQGPVMQERLAPPPMAMHPAYVRQYSSQSSAEDNPFFTPQERSEHSYEMEAEPVRPAELGTGQQGHHTERGMGEAVSNRRSSSSVRRHSRPTTPFSPVGMRGLASAAPPQHLHGNPFTSLEDDEADDVISPIIPVRSPERRHSPMVHYPSWNEISEFDFVGDQHARASMGGQLRAEDGGDGYRPARRESVLGRHELA
ncbi:hypothetical protein LTR08_008922 [Meristemomyces frigidus]|nr:hypothetical protein LTR08_008922 [Meristemomyces frigidus]